MRNFLFLFIFFSISLYSQSVKISGTITDSATSKPLSFASVRVSGSNQGTSSNMDGEYSIKLKKGKHTLIFSYIGYKTDSLLISADRSMSLDIDLCTKAIVLPEVVVNEEDPAYRIIREAIRRKEKNRRGLKNFEYDAYSKKIIKSVGEVALIEESFVKGYKKIGKWEKEFIKSRHRTENIKKYSQSMNVNITNSFYVDFSRDTLSLFMNTIFLPLAENAFDYYDYKLLQTSVSTDYDIYEINVIPKSSIQPLLEGIITIDSRDYALNSIKLRTNEGVRFPYINNLKADFTQRLSKQLNYWLPLYVEYNASMDINIQGLIKIGTMEFNQLSNITNYKINQPIPDSIENAQKSSYGAYTVDTSKSVPKPLELSRIEIDSLREIPLTQKEIGAYERLDSSMTMQKLVKVEGALAGLIPDEDSINDTTKSILGMAFELANNYLEFRNNRVTGLLFGLKINYPVLERLQLNTSLGYSLKRDDLEGKINLKYSFKETWISSVEAGYFNYSAPWQSLIPYPDFVNSIGVTLGLEDHFNYYLSKGFMFSFSKDYKELYSLKLKFTSESQKYLEEHQYQSLFYTNRKVKPNPQILEGKNNLIKLNFSYGRNPLEPQVLPGSGLIIKADFSSKSIKSDYEYQQVRLIGMLHTNTFFDELFISPFFQIIIDGGFVTGDYGPQHILTPNSAYSFYSPFGVLKGLKPYQYVGTEMIALHLEHNWRTIPFQAIGLNFIADLHLDIITGASGLKLWNNSEYFSHLKMKDPNYWETYISISRIFAIGRVDFAYTSLDQFHIRAAIGIIL